MNSTYTTAGRLGFLASDVCLGATTDDGDTLVSLISGGSLEPYTGTMDLYASGALSAAAGEASLQLTSSLGSSSAVLDGGPAGVVQLCNSLPVGVAQQLELDSVGCSVKLSNGNVLGTMQTIQLHGESQSIVISAGGLPVSPTIKLTPEEIVLSCGPTSSIKINAEGVTINGLQVGINGEVETSIKAPAVSVEASANATVKGAMVEVEGSATTMVKGGMVMIN